jgi:hypothetical protein
MPGKPPARTVRFRPGKPMPASLLRKLIEYPVAENAG